MQSPAKLEQGEEKTPPHPLPKRALMCPRCSSRDTKFCYYNNYSYKQPRYICKSCMRYWTVGGTLRNVPIGGGRKKKRRSPSPSSAPSKKGKEQAALPPPPSPYRSVRINFSPLSSLQNVRPEDFQLGNPSHIAPPRNTVVVPPPPTRFLDILRTTEMLSVAARSTIRDFQPLGRSGNLESEQMRALAPAGSSASMYGRQPMLPPFIELGRSTPAYFGQQTAHGLSMEIEGNNRMQFMNSQPWEAGFSAESRDETHKD